MATIRVKKKIPGVPARANRGRIRDTGTYGNHQSKKKKFLAYQRGPTGAELGTLGHMATIRPKKKFLVYQQGPTGAELGTLGHMATIRLKKKIPGVPARANRGRIRDTGTYGNHQTEKNFLVYQQGPTGAELGTLGHMATIRLKKKIPGVPARANRGRIRDTGTYGNHQSKKKKFLAYQRGPTGAELGTLGHMATIRLKKNSWCTSRGQQGQN